MPSSWREAPGPPEAAVSIRVRSLDPQEWGLWRELRLRAFATRTGPFLEAEVDGEPAGMAPAGEMIGDPSSAAR